MSPEAATATPVPVSDEARHWLTEAARCVRCGLGLARLVGLVDSQGGWTRWEIPGDWVHDTTLRAACDPAQVAWQEKQQAADKSGVES